MKSFNKVISTVLMLVLLTGVFIAALPVQGVQASSLQEGNPPKGDENGNGKFAGLVKQRLERIYERELNGLDKQAERIAKLADVSARFQSRIDTLQEKDIDTTALEAALAEFESKVPVIESAHNQAADILVEHTGFNNVGKVVNIESARQTLRSAGDAMREAHQLMKETVRTLLQAGRRFKEDIRPQPVPEA